ncbi:MAG TPA: bifunctional serine/threonine-protein kinase/formylglycine-generating enzyme family protein [Tepidisphaeraceae bacterium]|jgi:serine/threonine protein kinase|nr:bifunctional serine/threonine-protein kinase/formylglycine-generating enzyme family protein [Tepidisphaeraceae bacterium]
MKQSRDNSSKLKEQTDGAREKLVRAAIYELLSRRQKGEDVDLEQFQSDRAELMPELSKAIASALRTYRHVLDAKRAWDDASTNTPVTQSESRSLPAIQGYLIRRELGSGGQGTVFEAVHEPTGRIVAVKILTGISKNAVARFDREARTLAILSHPGLLAILDRGVTREGTYYLTVEYVEGVDLDEWINRLTRGKASERTLVTLFLKVASALGAAHSQGIVHRDLKPSNIRVDGLGNPRIIDFGMARLVEQDEEDRRLTATRDVVGSVNWLSPEQVSGNVHKVGPTSDVHAIGVMMYHAFTSTFPFAADGSIIKILREICEKRPNNPSSIPGPFGKCSPILATVLMKCLNKEPSSRYPDASALASELEAYLAGKLHLSPKNQQRNWTIGVTIGSLVLYFTWFYIRHSAIEPIQVIQLPTFTNSVGMTFVQAPSGAFKMGSPYFEAGHRDDEQPHVVNITHPFWIGQTEVTQAEYRQVTGSLPAGVQATPGDFPVDHVSLKDAEAFCLRLHDLDGRDYRLPTEAEWEYACRAGTSGAFSTSPTLLPQVAWFAGNSGGALHAVGKRQPNSWGLYDMHGNVAELTADLYIPYLGTSPQSDPVHTIGETSFVVRGGSAKDFSEDCRSARRISILPKAETDGIGFRVVAIIHSSLH